MTCMTVDFVVKPQRKSLEYELSVLKNNDVPGYGVINVKGGWQDRENYDIYVGLSGWRLTKKGDRYLLTLYKRDAWIKDRDYLVLFLQKDGDSYTLQVVARASYVDGTLFESSYSNVEVAEDAQNRLLKVTFRGPTHGEFPVRGEAYGYLPDSF